MKLLFSTFILVLFISPAFSQGNCEVLMESIRGKYTGGCKKDKADGQGKSEGTDKYEGNFKSGYPSGMGTYTYKNGDFYTGNFSKGIKDGKGEFHYKKGEDEPDSIVTGFWKNDAYFGTYLRPYEILSKTSGFNRLEVKTDVAVTSNTVTLSSQNTIKMDPILKETGVTPIPIVDQMQLIEGSYSHEEKSIVDKRQIIVYKNVVFPFHFKAVYNTENYEVIISKPGNWTVLAQISER
ncbi:MAG: hypothetical protein QM737_11095 [Ferruginibacter sp.]